METIHDVIAYDCVGILNSALTHFNVISVEYLVKGAFFWGNGYLLDTRKTVSLYCIDCIVFLL